MPGIRRWRKPSTSLSSDSTSGYAGFDRPGCNDESGNPKQVCSTIQGILVMGGGARFEDFHLCAGATRTASALWRPLLPFPGFPGSFTQFTLIDLVEYLLHSYHFPGTQPRPSNPARGTGVFARRLQGCSGLCERKRQARDVYPTIDLPRSKFRFWDS